MSKHPTRKEKQRLFSLIDQMEWLFSVNNFRRTISFAERDLEEIPVNAEVFVDIPYQTLRIVIYPRFWEMDLEQQRMCVLHEYCHMLTNPIQQKAKDLFEGKFHTEDSIVDATEEATSKVTQLLGMLLGGNGGYAREAFRAYAKPEKIKRKKRKKTKKKK